MAKRNFGQNLFTGNVSVPTGYMVVPIEEYTRLVEESMKHAIMEEHIPEDWCKSVLDVFMVGMADIKERLETEAAWQKAREQEAAEKKRKEEEEAKKHICPDPGKLKSLMGTGWSAEDLADEFRVSTGEIYTWMGELLLGKYDGALTIANMEVR